MNKTSNVILLILSIIITVLVSYFALLWISYLGDNFCGYGAIIIGVFVYTFMGIFNFALLCFSFFVMLYSISEYKNKQVKKFLMLWNICLFIAFVLVTVLYVIIIVDVHFFNQNLI